MLQLQPYAYTTTVQLPSTDWKVTKPGTSIWDWTSPRRSQLTRAAMTATWVPYVNQQQQPRDSMTRPAVDECDSPPSLHRPQHQDWVTHFQYRSLLWWWSSALLCWCVVLQQDLVWSLSLVFRGMDVLVQHFFLIFVWQRSQWSLKDFLLSTFFNIFTPDHF